MKHRTDSVKQVSIVSVEFAAKKRVSRPEKFLGEMNHKAPFADLEAQVEPRHRRYGPVGRSPPGIAGMLGKHSLQLWPNLSDVGLEHTIYDSQPAPELPGNGLSWQDVQHATTLVESCCPLEGYARTEKIAAQINAHLSEHRLLLRKGTMADVTVVEAPPSTKNKEQARDPEMRQTKKGNQWHFDMKGRIGTDAESGLVHGLPVISAYESDFWQAYEALNRQETEPFADVGYIGVTKLEEIAKPQVADAIRQVKEWNVAAKRALVKAMPEVKIKEQVKKLEHLKTQTRSRVEHLLRLVDDLLRHRETRSKSLARKEVQMFSLFGLGSLARAKKKLISVQAQVAA